MFERKPDLKDEIIALLRQDKERLELRVAELVKQNMALADKAAYRTLYPREPLAQDGPPAEPFVHPTRLTYKPKLSFAEVAEIAKRRAEEN
jgi:hypothetical protein